jgi:predicted phosphohydrolase
MHIWALSDPHLSFHNAAKSMEVFGPLWDNYTQKMQDNWKRLIRDDDLVLIPGDISWAMRLEEALIDLTWLDKLPGTKVLIKGNHDYWWDSLSKLSKSMPPSLHCIHNNVFVWNGVAIGGTRLWDTPEYSFEDYIHFQKNERQKVKTISQEEEKTAAEKIFARELQRLELSLSQMPKDAILRIALTHYPPIDATLQPSRTSQILENHKIDFCVFGHLHSIDKTKPMFGKIRGVEYILSSCDYLDFVPKHVIDLESLKK